MAYVKLSQPPTIGNVTPNTGEFTTVGVGAAAVTSGLYVNVSNRISTWITGTNISTGSDADGLFVDASFAPSANVTNCASIGLYPTFNPGGGVTITNGYGLYIASGTQGGAGSVTTGYGLYVTSPTFGTSNFAANIGGLVINSGGTGTISAGIWNGTAIDVAHGGTGQITLTAHSVLIGNGTTAISQVGPVASTGALLASNGVGSDPGFTTATYPLTTAQGDLLSSTSANTIVSLAKDTNATRYLANTGTTNNAKWDQVALSNGVSGQLPLANGGTNANLTASNGGIFYSTATAGAILAGTATANQVLLSGSSTTPAWSTATYPATTTSQQILYSTAANVVGQLTTANSALPATNSSGTLAMRTFSVVNQVFTSTGTYTPTSGMLYCIIQCLGGGGAGGGAAATGAGTTSPGGGGGGGEYAQGVFSAATIGASQSVTIGAAGTGSSGTTGGSGGTTSVGSTLISCGGGSGGLTAAASGNYAPAAGGVGGTGGTGGSFRVNGNSGSYGQACNSPGIVTSGQGANSQFGTGGPSSLTSDATGNTAAVYGAGGGGAVNYTSASARAGGAGSKGLVVVTEFVIS